MTATKLHLKKYFGILLSVFVFIFPTASHGEYSNINKRPSNPNAPIILILGSNLKQNNRNPRHSNRLVRHSTYDRNDNVDQDSNVRNNQLSPDISNLLASLFSYKTLSNAKSHRRPKYHAKNDRHNRYRTSSHYNSNKNNAQSYGNYYKNDRNDDRIYNDNDNYKTIILDRNDKLNYNSNNYKNDRYISKNNNFRNQDRDKKYNDKRNRLDVDGDAPLVKTLLRVSNAFRKDSCEDTDSCEEQATTTEDPCELNDNSCDEGSDDNISTRGVPSDFVSEIPPNCCK